MYMIQFVKRILPGLILLGGVFNSARLFAQQADSTWVDFEYVRNANAWLSSGSVTGLNKLPVDKISRAAISFNKSNGSFINYFQSNNSLTLGAATESYYRLNPKVVLMGKVLYENFNGKNMGGSAMIDPYKNPIDIDENADTTQGKKKQERYNLQGAVSAKVSNRLTLGAGIDYTAANYVKTKDLRHINKLTDIHITGGASYALTRAIEIGAEYAYTRRIESVGFAVYGNTDRQYISLINFGSFFGLAELFTDNGYTSETRPLVNNTHTGTLQLGITLKPGVQFINRFSYGVRKGYYGNRGTSSIVFTEHNADEYNYEGVLSVKKRNALHNFSVKAGLVSLENMENVYRLETSTGGNRVIVYYGQNESMTQDITSASFEYTGYLGIQNNNPTWTIKAGAAYYSRQQTVNRYPYYRKQDINSYGAYLSAGRNIIKGKNMYTLALRAGYGAGSGTAKNDGTYATPSSGQIKPASRDIYLYREYEYFTKPRMEIGPQMQYSYFVNKGVTAFLKLNYQYTKASDVSFTGTDLKTFNVSVGCNF